MHGDPASHGSEHPSDVYSRRMRDLESTLAAEQQRHRLFGFAKLAVAAIAFLAAIFLLRHTQRIALLLIPIALYILLAILHDKLIRSIRTHTRAIDFCRRGLDRLADRWAGKGETGDRFLDPEHPYARDLDLFGKASLFELLSTARTRAGEETLAAWLLAAAPVDEVLLRQQAVSTLQHRVPFREQLFLLGDTVRTGVNPAALIAWGERGPAFPSRATRVATSLLAILWVGSLVAWGLWDLGWVAASISVLNLAWAHRLYARVDAAASAAEDATQDLELLAGVLSLLEHEPFTAPRLLDLQAALRTGGVPPSIAIRKLARTVEYLKHRHNRFFRPLDLFVFWAAHFLFAVETWQRRFGPQIRAWLQAVGEFEALVSLSTYAYEHPADVFPEFTAGAALFHAQGLAHPLLPAAHSVRNHFTLGDGLELVILSGPNMSGKSTFIRAIGLNAVLAQCGAPVRAARLRLSPLAVAASICILDSLSGGVSRFYAEIRKIKLITDLTRGPAPVLFLLDELLSGTNSDDRLAGTEFVVRSLVARQAIGIVSTHDLALARIPDAMGARAANFSFEGRLENNRLLFDYTLHPGIAKTRSALELMQSIGLDIHT
jgi:hypothetical protein